MKKSVSIAFLGVSLFALSGLAQASEVSGPDQFVTVVQCRNTSGLPSGLSVRIVEGGFTGGTFAQLTNRDGLGPFVDLGQIAVTLKKVPHGVMGAGVTYLGKGFELHVNTDSPGTDEGFYSSVYADIQGRVFDERMVCEFPYHPN